MKSRSQSGVALVITLIMLAVITIIAVAFLALSQSERASVSQTLTGTDAERMANVALDRARAHILADMTAFLSNPTNWSTNRILTPPPRVFPTALGPDLTVSMTYTNSTNSYETPGLSNAERNEAMTNLLEDPRVPVFVSTEDRDKNRNRFYLDLNRNNQFEPSGIVPVLDENGNTIGNPPELHYAVGDPEWIGVPSRINEWHSGTNRFIGRYAYMIVPIGRTLDFNFVHNYAKRGGPPTNGFYRNQGHASWEINLAAFLTELNNRPGIWDTYTYDPRFSFSSSGAAFFDATEVLMYRYRRGYGALDTADAIFGSLAANFRDDGIDEYVDGQLSPAEDDTSQPWPGASNPQQFFTVHDLFNPSPYLRGFTNRMWMASTNKDSYNRHTFYRMLSQIATDTAPEDITDERVNINYANYKTASNAKGYNPAEFVDWRPEEFLQVAADRIFRENGFFYDGDPRRRLSVTNLIVYEPRQMTLPNGQTVSTFTNYYTPAVHRVLQMVLNIYDARFNRATNGSAYPYYPTVLQPLFEKRGNRIVVARYQEVDTMIDGVAAITAVDDPNRWRDLNDFADVRDLQPTDFVYGVPFLVGAKKGLPNFNEFFFQSQIQFERKLLVEKGVNREYLRTNQMFLIGVSNSMGLEVWNSYTNTYRYPRALQLYAAVETSTSLMNDMPFQQVWNDVVVTRTNIPLDTWRGGEFRFPVANTNGIWTNRVIVPESIYMQNTFFPTNPPRWEPIFPAPQWVLTTTNRLRYFLFDNGRIIDAVGLAPMVVSTNITQALATNHLFGPLWSTNRGGSNSRDVRAPTQGIVNQLAVSQGDYVLGLNDNWADFQTYPTTAAEKAAFKTFLRTNGNPTVERRMAPFTPQVKIYWRPEWRANDPFVHYVDEDLRLDRNVEVQFTSVSASTNRASAYLRHNVGKINVPEYQPWGGAPGTAIDDQSKIDRYENRTLTDPLVRRSDDWDFPTNKFASIGELGRVHRGTPWQTIYLKSTPAPASLWARVNSSMRAHPTNDWCVADVFTVAQHPNASRGVLSINQTNAAAWSALFSGVEIPVLTNGAGGIQRTRKILEPALVEGHITNLVNGINDHRTNFQGKVFSKLAQFLSTPVLTTNSPYLDTPFLSQAVAQERTKHLTDADWEAIPRSILSLVKVGEPRFLIYAFGQSLKPAQGSVQTAAGYRGLVTNYEVTGELATRAVVRVELDSNGDDPPVPRAIIESFNIIPPD